LLSACAVFNLSPASCANAKPSFNGSRARAYSPLRYKTMPVSMSACAKPAVSSNIVRASFVCASQSSAASKSPCKRFNLPSANCASAFNPASSLLNSNAAR
jgi:hypothetical protein